MPGTRHLHINNAHGDEQECQTKESQPGLVVGLVHNFQSLRRAPTPSVGQPNVDDQVTSTRVQPYRGQELEFERNLVPQKEAPRASLIHVETHQLGHPKI